MWQLVLIGLVVLVVFALITLYNGILNKRLRCDTAWQNIDAQLQRRFDLITNLVATIKGATKHESETFEEVTRLRSGYMNATTPEAKMAIDNQMTSTLKSLFAVAEAYPVLQANQNFLSMQDELRNTEDTLSYARMTYNETVYSYNYAIQSFPGVLVASLFRFTPREGYAIDNEEARVRPNVEF